MVEDSSKRVEKSADVLDGGFEWRCSRFRGYLLVLLLLIVLTFYYVYLSGHSASWTSGWWKGDRAPNIKPATHKASHSISMTSADVTINAITTTSTNSTNKTINIDRSEKIVQMLTPAPWKSPGPYHVAYPHKYNFILNEPDKCRKDSPFLVLIVPVAPKKQAVRNAIRSTWGNESLVLDKVVSLLFLLGLPSAEDRGKLQEEVQLESKEHHDLLQSDFLDSYHNLTIKTMVMLEWLITHCPNASYAMKIDSDMFLNVHNLIEMLLNAPKQNYMTGLVEKGATVLRNPNSKWYLPKSAFPEPVYPPYALGLGYVFSLDLPRKLVEGAKHVEALYIEDIYLGLCMRHVGIQPTDPPNHNLFHVFHVPYNRCRYAKLIATTTRSLTEQVHSWRDLKKLGPPCP